MGCELPGCSPMDSRTVVARRRPRARRVTSRCWKTMLRPVVHSFGHASSSLSLLLSPSSLSLFRGSRAAAPKLPEIIGFFCFPVIRRMARSLARSLRRSMSFLPVSVTLSASTYTRLSLFLFLFARPPLSSPFPSDNAPATSATMSFLLLVFLRRECSSSSISFVTRCPYFPAFVPVISRRRILLLTLISGEMERVTSARRISVETEFARIAIPR